MRIQVALDAAAVGEVHDVGLGEPQLPLPAVHRRHDDDAARRRLQADVGLRERAVEALDQIVGELRRDAGPQRELLRLRRRGPRRAGGGAQRDQQRRGDAPGRRRDRKRDDVVVMEPLPAGRSADYTGTQRVRTAGAMTIDDKCGGCSPSAPPRIMRALRVRVPWSPRAKEHSCGRWRSGPRSSWLADRSGSHRAAPRHRPAEGPRTGRRRPDRHPGAGAEGPFDRHSQGEAGAVPEGHGCEEAPDASHDRGRQVQREHPAHHRRGNGAGASHHRGPVGRARRRRHADHRRRAREGQDPRRPEPADQGGRRRLHPLGAAARRERRRQEHHVAQRAVGHGLAARLADGRGHAERPPRPAGACRGAARA